MNNISPEALENLNSSIQNLFNATSRVLEEAGVPHTDKTATHSDTAALGVSTSVTESSSTFSPAPWVAIGVIFFIGVSLLVTAIIKSFHPEPSKSERISAAVDAIIAHREELKKAEEKDRL